MILWFMSNLSSACKQITHRGTWYPTDSMILVLIFQSLYIVDALYNEVSFHVFGLKHILI
jgi:hypothetical protein